MLTNLVRAGLARITNSAYAPLPTMYDALFPDGTFLTSPTRSGPAEPAPERAAEADGTER